jgi:hypothetical protein
MGYVVQMGEMRNIYQVLVAKFEGKRPFGRLDLNWRGMLK